MEQCLGRPPQYIESPRPARSRARYLVTSRASTAEAVRNALAIVRAGGLNYDVGCAVGAVVDALASDVISPGGAAAIVENLNTALGHDSQIERHSCGHWATESVEVRRRHGRRGYEYVCQECADEYYREPVDDSSMSHVEDLYRWDSDDEYHTEEAPEEEEEEDDSDDSDSNEPEGLMSYGTNALRHLTIDLSFRTTTFGDVHMGVELETVQRGDVANCIAAVRDELGHDYVIAKADGSLPTGGIEWVTRPTSLATHIAKLGAWDHSRRGLTAWKPGSCGMHVHIDSAGFTPLSLGKLIQFFNTPENADFLRGIAGRHPDRDSQAQSYAGYDVAPEQARSPLKALKGKNSSRYTMVNLSNLKEERAKELGLKGAYNCGGRYNTVEVRLFRATMHKPRLLAQLELVHALVMYARTASHREMNPGALCRWLAKRVGQYPHLCRWLTIGNTHGSATKRPAAPQLEPTEV